MLQPAIITVAAVFVTCPKCSTDIPLNTPDGETTDWSVAAAADYEVETDSSCLPTCPNCGQVVTIKLPKFLPVAP